MARGWRGRFGRAAPALVVLAVLGGCEILYFAAGKGNQPALFNFSKGQRVLVLVDVSNGVAAPPTFATTLADQIGNHLWAHKAVNVPLVPQDTLLKLQQTNPGYKNLGVADIAQETGADVVLYVNVRQLQTPISADGAVAGGHAEVLVKVIGREGNRIWPGERDGKSVTADLEMGMLSDRAIPEIIKIMSGLLTVRTGRMFHEYDMEDRSMNQ